MKYAEVIVNISHENIDKTYQYAIPEKMQQKAEVGSMVKISFGRGGREISGYIVALSDTAEYDPAKIKPILEIVENAVMIETKLICLAYWIKQHFGSTMNAALKTVLPVKKKVRQRQERLIKRKIPKEEAVCLLKEWERKHYTAKQRLLQHLLDREEIDYGEAVREFHISKSVIDAFERDGIIETTSSLVYRNPVAGQNFQGTKKELTEEQSGIVKDFRDEYSKGIRRTYLLHGITGSGKTEVYMEMIDGVIKEGKQVIVLIPEIALTYQNVNRFFMRFGSGISILNSKMSSGERYDQYVRAKNGDIDIMIGPRSALFTPFTRLGLIIIDEEHEGSYKSEMPPKYHARETAIARAEMEGASVVLGSATPSLESYKKAMDGEFKYYRLEKRIGDSSLADVSVVDLRRELREGNKSIFSRKLKALIAKRLEKKQQVMLFINRRGYAGFISCRSCGHVIKCPHCDVSLTSHNNGTLVCHYCGFEEKIPKKCPSCGSPFIAPFGTGTQKVEQYVRHEFPEARILRMDADTTKAKGQYEQILSEFAAGRADILVGTQMIVKGHDFPNVTLVGIIAADLSLYAPDFRASERTFQLLTQAAGRAGRGKEKGDVVIQTYQPEHYSIIAAAHQDYEEFYRYEMGYRNIMDYPPAAFLAAVLVSSKDEKEAVFAAENLSGMIERYAENKKQLKKIGPAKASVSRINDIHRQVIYLKNKQEKELLDIKNYLEEQIQKSGNFKECTVQFDMNPVNGY